MAEFHYDDAERQRRELVRLLQSVLDTRPVRRKPRSGFPFILLERFFDGLQFALERAIDRTVKAILTRLEKPRDKLRERISQLWQQLAQLWQRPLS